MDTSSFCVGSKSRALVLKRPACAWRPAATSRRPLPGVSTRKTTGWAPGSKANQRIRVESASAHEDCFCRCGLDRSLRSAGRSEAVGTGFSVGEPPSRAYAGSPGPPERENPNALASWMRLRMRRFAAYAVASLRKSNAGLRIWGKRSKNTSRVSKLSIDARCWTRSRASVSKPLRSSQVSSDLPSDSRAHAKQRRRPCASPLGVGYVRSRQSSNVEGPR